MADVPCDLDSYRTVFIKSDSCLRFLLNAAGLRGQGYHGLPRKPNRRSSSSAYRPRRFIVPSAARQPPRGNTCSLSFPMATFLTIVVPIAGPRPVRAPKKMLSMPRSIRDNDAVTSFFLNQLFERVEAGGKKWIDLKNNISMISPGYTSRA